MRWHLFPVLYSCCPQLKPNTHTHTHTNVRSDTDGYARKRRANVQRKPWKEGRCYIFLCLARFPPQSACPGSCSDTDGQMCVRKKSLQRRWQAPFKLNCLNQKFIICKLWSGLASCYMERVWKKCQGFCFCGWSAATCHYYCLVFFFVSALLA